MRRLITGVVVAAVSITVIPVAAAACPTGTTELSGGVCQQKFTTAGTFTVPSGVTTLDVLLVGVGGGGQAVNGGGAGGGGGEVKVVLAHAVTTGTPLNVVVGTGGAGGLRIAAARAAMVATPRSMC